MKDNVVLIASVLIFIFIVYIDVIFFESKGFPFIIYGAVSGFLYYYVKHSKHFD